MTMSALDTSRMPAVGRDTATPAPSGPVELRAEPSDMDLITRINAGETEAWDSLMDRYAGKAYQIAFGLLGQRDDAEEVTQDAFVRIYRALPKFRGDSEFSTWMYRIVVNQARNKYRWNKRRGAHVNMSIDQELRTDDGSVLALDLPDGGKTPDRELVYKEWQVEIAREMEHLPSVNREALILRNVKNMSYEDIAQVLKCKVGTVKSRIARAREELRRRLGL
jgi:RNA polymerase sigma-70 factor, ECF subfamily